MWASLTLGSILSGSIFFSFFFHLHFLHLFIFPFVDPFFFVGGGGTWPTRRDGWHAYPVQLCCGACHAAPQVSIQYLHFCTGKASSKLRTWWRERGVASKNRLLHLHLRAFEALLGFDKRASKALLTRLTLSYGSINARVRRKPLLRRRPQEIGNRLLHVH